MIVREALALGIKALTQGGISNPPLDSQVILGFVLGKDKLELFVEPQAELSIEQQAQYAELLALRCKHIPIAYITGQKEFYGLDFYVNPQVLIPRPETEFVVEEVLKLISVFKAPKIADICCGSGTIAVSVAVHNNSVVIYATDILAVCGKVTIKNAETHGVRERVVFLQGDLLEPLKNRDIDGLDLIASNPPYIPREEIEFLPEDVREEPLLALDGGCDGLKMYRKLIKLAPTHLKPGGKIVLEIGWNQAEDVKGLLQAAGFDYIRVIKDFLGFNRVVSAQLKE